MRRKKCTAILIGSHCSSCRLDALSSVSCQEVVRFVPTETEENPVFE